VADQGAINVLCPQSVIATVSANALDGVIHPSVCRDLVLNERATGLLHDPVTG